MKVFKKLKIVFISLFLFIGGFQFLSAQVVDLDETYAGQSFREGVMACQFGYYNKAYLSFEKSLTYKPDNLLARYWMGVALYRNGYTIEAIEIWKEISDKGFMSDYFNSFFEIRKFRENISASSVEPEFVEAEVIDSEYNGITFFDRPTTLETDSNGGFGVVSSATDQILFYDANGDSNGRIFGDLVGLNRIYDIIRLKDNKNYFITDFSLNHVLKITSSGQIKKKFGKQGINAEQFLGPQYLTCEEDKYLFISDAGNRKIVKTDMDGHFILSFGQKTPFFEGFLLPTGVLYHMGDLYVADRFRRKVYKFDTSGNYLETVISYGLESPEAISAYDSKSLLVADRTSIQKLNIETNETSKLIQLNSKDGIFVDSAVDSNGNIIIPDYSKNKIYIYSDVRNFYVGLDINIESINVMSYPEIFVNAVVRDKEGKPYRGLSKQNFSLFEDSMPIYDFSVVYADEPDTAAAISFIKDSRLDISSIGNALEKSVKDFFPDMKKNDFVTVVSSGKNPSIRYKSQLKGDGVKELKAITDSLVADTSGNNEMIFDYSVRAAAGSLLNITSKKSIVFFTDGKVPDKYFKDYGLIRIADLLKNNNIIFNCVLLRSDFKVHDDLKFLCKYTGGKVYQVYSPAGVTTMVDDIRQSISGRYTLKYTADSDSDFGKKYFPIDLSVKVMKRAGKGYSGYFSPVR